MARDWSRAFLRASFRGVPFWVEYDSLSGGRRVAVSNIAYGEQPITEDFGRRPRELPPGIYLAGDNADIEAAALTAALDAPGPAMLVLPQGGGTLAHCADFTRNRMLDRNGYIGFDVTFIASGSPSVRFAVDIGFGAVLSAFIAFALVAGRAYSLLSLVANVVAPAQKSVAGKLNRLVEETVDDPFEQQAWQDLRDYSLSDNGDIDTFIPIISDALIELAGNDRQLFARIEVLHQEFADEEPTVAVMAQSVTLAAMALIAVSIDIETRAEAKTLRATLSKYADHLADQLGTVAGFEVAEQLTVCVGLAVRSLSFRSANLAPAVMVENEASLPAARIAWEMYGDPERAAELVERNGIATPALMPVRIEALAR